MTHNRQMNEQDNRGYRYRATASVSRPVQRREAPIERGSRRADRERREMSRMPAPPAENPAYRRRVVSMPKEVVEPTTWAERRARLRGGANQPHTAHSSHGRHRLVQRTLAQTGVPAPVGQIRVPRPLPRSRASSPIPARSGQHARRRGLWGRFLAIFAVLVVGVVGGSFALTSSTFRIQQVNVQGTQDRGLVKSIEGMGMQGQNIFLFDAQTYMRRIQGLPLVANADLGKQLPNLVTVTVQERVPVLLWQAPTGTFAVDSTGVVIAPAGEVTAANHLASVVDLRGGAAARLHTGMRLQAGDIAFAQQAFARLPQIAGVGNFVMRYVNSMPATQPGQRPLPVNVAGKGSYVVVSANGWVAYLGSPDDANPLENRLLELQQILTLAQQQQLSLATIDLRFGLHPVYTLK